MFEFTFTKKVNAGTGTFKDGKEIKARKHAMEEYGAAYAAEGLVTLAGSRLYTSAADTDEVIDDALARFGRVLAQADVPAKGAQA